MPFTVIPNVPVNVGLSDAESRFMSALKQNVELVTNQRGNGAYAAIVKGQLTIPALGSMSLQQITAVGAYVTISGSDVVLVSDYNKLLSNFVSLANDVSETRSKLNALIAALKG